MLPRNSFVRLLSSAIALHFLCTIAPHAHAQWSQTQVVLTNVTVSGLYTTTDQTTGWSVCAYQNSGNVGCSISGDVETTFVQSGSGWLTVEKKANNTAYAGMGNGYAKATADGYVAEWDIVIPAPPPTPTFDFTYPISVTTTPSIHIQAAVQGHNLGATSTGWITGS